MNKPSLCWWTSQALLFCKGNRLRQQDCKQSTRICHPGDLPRVPKNKDWLWPVFSGKDQWISAKTFVARFWRGICSIMVSRSWHPSCRTQAAETHPIAQGICLPRWCHFSLYCYLVFTSRLQGKNYAYLLQHKYKYYKWDNDCKWGRATKQNHLRLNLLLSLKHP